MIVMDASALLELLLQTERAERIAAIALKASQRLRAPHLLDIEIAHVLRRLLLQGEISATRARQALEDYRQITIERHAHLPFLARIFKLHPSLTAYDSAYVVLSEALDAPLLTCDARLARSHGHRASITLI